MYLPEFLRPIRDMTPVQRFFHTARERHEIYRRRLRGGPPPYTEDPIFRDNRFCNVFRELDKTTQWCKKHVRDVHQGMMVVPAVVMFRAFNKIETGELLFGRRVVRGMTPFRAWWEGTATRDQLAAAIRENQHAPYITAAYIIKTPDGMDKVTGVLDSLVKFRDQTQRSTGAYSCPTGSLREFWGWLRSFPYQGDFSAYEVTSDLRWTPLLSRAPDIMTWANAGPGAVRGLNRIASRPTEMRATLPRSQAEEEMRNLLQLSRDPSHWPPGWGRWEMREVEHWLCEFDKYERIRSGEGRTKQRFPTRT